MIKVKSSQIAELGHDAETNTLAVRFHGKGDKLGTVYHYRNVNTELFEELRDAESIGGFFIRHIKKNPDRYPYERQTETST